MTIENRFLEAIDKKWINVLESSPVLRPGSRYGCLDVTPAISVGELLSKDGAVETVEAMISLLKGR